MPKQDDKRQNESRRIIERVSQESDMAGGSMVGNAAQRVRDHVSAADTDPEDWAEYWGKRIGRTLGLIITIGLIGWLLLYVLGAG
jgi:hypothetical protein